MEKKKEKPISVQIQTFNWFKKKYSKSSRQLNKEQIELFDIISELNEPFTLTEDRPYDLKAYVLAIKDFLFKSCEGVYVAKDSEFTSVQGIVIAGSNEDDNKKFYMDHKHNASRHKYIIDKLSEHFCYVFNKTQSLLRTPERSIGKNKKSTLYKITPQLDCIKTNEKPFTAKLHYCEIDTQENIINVSKGDDIGEIVANESGALFSPLGIKTEIHKGLVLCSFDSFFPAYAVFLNKEFKKEEHKHYCPF